MRYPWHAPARRGACAPHAHSSCVARTTTPRRPSRGPSLDQYQTVALHRHTEHQPSSHKMLRLHACVRVLAGLSLSHASITHSSCGSLPDGAGSTAAAAASGTWSGTASCCAVSMSIGRSDVRGEPYATHGVHGVGVSSAPREGARERGCLVVWMVYCQLCVAVRGARASSNKLGASS